MTWRPRNNNNVNREYFLAIINGNNGWEKVLNFIFKHKRRHFKKERYAWFFEQKEVSKQDLIEEQKEPGNFLDNQDNISMDTGRDHADVSDEGFPEEEKVNNQMTTINNHQIKVTERDMIKNKGKYSRIRFPISEDFTNSRYR